MQIGSVPLDYTTSALGAQGAPPPPPQQSLAQQKKDEEHGVTNAPNPDDANGRQVNVVT